MTVTVRCRERMQGRELIKFYKIMKGNKVVVNQFPQYENEEEQKILFCKAENF